jgi:hypothetical protein
MRFRVRGVLDPNHKPAARAQRRRDAVDVGHDFDCLFAQRMGDAFHQKGVLHIDGEKRGIVRDKIVEDVLASARAHDLLYNRFRNIDFVHGIASSFGA